MSAKIQKLQNLLDYCVAKNKTIARNIANIGTENYKREDVVFKDQLETQFSSLLKTSSNKHIVSPAGNEASNSNLEIVYDDSSEMISGINNVSIEHEMAELAENTLRFKFASKKVGEYYKTIQNVIKGGSRI